MSIYVEEAERRAQAPSFCYTCVKVLYRESWDISEHGPCDCEEELCDHVERHRAAGHDVGERGSK